MILPLRQRHHRMVIALGVFLPVAFAVGIVARKPAPVTDALPAALVTTPQEFKTVVWERADLFAKTPVRVRLLGELKDPGPLAIGFSAAKDFIKPDLIVYWVAGSPAITDTLPADAILLGTFSAPALPLPVRAVKASGSLILYSLADNEIVDVSKVVSFQK